MFRGMREGAGHHTSPLGGFLKEMGRERYVGLGWI
jgi:hypothetical protein